LFTKRLPVGERGPQLSSKWLFLCTTAVHYNNAVKEFTSANYFVIIFFRKHKRVLLDTRYYEESHW